MAAIRCLTRWGSSRIGGGRPPASRYRKRGCGARSCTAGATACDCVDSRELHLSWEVGNKVLCMRFYLCVGVLSVGLVLASRAAFAQTAPWGRAARVAEQQVIRALDGAAWPDHLHYHQQVGGEPSWSCYWEQQRLYYTIQDTPL